MCDTVVADPSTTADGVMLFAKNSDRQRNEAQVVEVQKARKNDVEAKLNCTYIAIEQVPRTAATLLSRPFWCWGAEMGANEFGVVVGNEGLHAKSPSVQKPALTGMDLVRLALERSSTASEAVAVITQLLEQYGQGGNCGHLDPNYYHNGFIVADQHEAFALETIERDWMVERVDGVRALSNVYSITNPQHQSPTLDCLIEKSGWGVAPIGNYAEAITSPGREHIGFANARRSRSNELLERRRGVIDLWTAFSLLRDHGRDDMAAAREPNPAEVTICMHATSAEKAGQTVGSWVSSLSQEAAVHWVTATAAPCLSIFKPISLTAAPACLRTAPTDKCDPRTLWWLHERWHRRALASNFAEIAQEISGERDELERSFIARMELVKDAPALEQASAISSCWSEARRAEERWLARSSDWQPRSLPANDEWTRLSRIAGLPIDRGRDQQ